MPESKRSEHTLAGGPGPTLGPWEALVFLSVKYAFSTFPGTFSSIFSTYNSDRSNQNMCVFMTNDSDFFEKEIWSHVGSQPHAARVQGPL